MNFPLLKQSTDRTSDPYFVLRRLVFDRTCYDAGRNNECYFIFFAEAGYYERLIHKFRKADEDIIRRWVGKDGCARMDEMERELSVRYDLQKELQFPFGKDYGWGFRYAHKSKPLCWLFFEKGAVTVTVSLPDGVLPGKEERIDSLLPKTKELWENRYPCGKCAMIHTVSRARRK
jgi:hypothetical protein